MSNPTEGKSPHRDGLEAVLAQFEAWRRRVVERAQALNPAARKQLLPEVVRQLEVLEARLVDAPNTQDELVAAEAVLGDYEKQVDLALSVIDELRERSALGAQGRLRRRRAVLLVATSLAVVGVGLVVWGRHADQQDFLRRRAAYFAGCRRRPECALRGLCSAPSPDKLTTAPSCVAAIDADCAASTDCEDQGKCSAVDGGCRAVNDVDCRRSRVCDSRGECSVDRGACRVLSSADCEHATACWERGECSMEQGACRAVTAADCARSSACKERGECSADRGTCRAVTAADCAHSKACRERGACAPREDKCEPSDDGCRATVDCKAFGRCAAVGSACAPKDAEDCKRSTDCLEFGHCAFVGGARPFCEVSNAGCRASGGCRRSGLCGISGDHCAVTSVDDCRQGARCREDGRCFLGVTERGQMVCVNSKGEP